MHHNKCHYSHYQPLSSELLALGEFHYGIYTHGKDHHHKYIIPYRCSCNGLPYIRTSLVHHLGKVKIKIKSRQIVIYDIGGKHNKIRYKEYTVYYLSCISLNWGRNAHKKHYIYQGKKVRDRHVCLIVIYLISQYPYYKIHRPEGNSKKP